LQLVNNDDHQRQCAFGQRLEFNRLFQHLTVGSAISRLGRRVKTDKTLAAKLAEATRDLSNAEM
jgi:hypothetical protein